MEIFLDSRLALGYCRKCYAYDETPKNCSVRRGLPGTFRVPVCIATWRTGLFLGGH